MLCRLVKTNTNFIGVSSFAKRGYVFYSGRNGFYEGTGEWDFTFEIEGYNRSKPDDERNPEAMDSRGCRQIFEGAYVAAVNKELLSLYYDLTLLLDIAKSRHFDEDYRAFLNRELWR